MNAQTDVAIEPKSQPLVIGRLERAKREADTLAEAIAVLYSRLHPVLSDSREACGDDPKPSYSVPLAASLEELGDSISDSASVLNYIIRNLEI
jgi:hypothetical protein